MIEDGRVLREGFVPSDVVHRDAEVNGLSRVLEPVTDSDPVEPSLITGPSGTGKTTITKLVVSRFRESVLDLESVHVNCWQSYSRFKAIYRILENETLVRTRNIRPRYTRICQTAGDEPLVPRRMRDHLGDLTMLGIADVTERNEGRRGGKYREYTLKTDTDTVVEPLDETINRVGVHQSLAEAGCQDVQTTLVDIPEQDD